MEFAALKAPGPSARPPHLEALPEPEEGRSTQGLVAGGLVETVEEMADAGGAVTQAGVADRRMRYRPPMNEAVIFDVDGVLVDSYHAHFESWQALAAEHGIEVTEEQFARTFGRTSRDIVLELWPEPPGDAAVRALDDRKEALYREIVGRRFPAMDGAAELIESLLDDGFVLAVGSSGPPPNVDLVLATLGRSSFAVTVTGHDVERGKPDPQVFLVAAERLGVDPSACVVVEDAAAGIRAARNAGMASVALVSTGHTVDELRGAGPDLVVRSLRELTPAALRGLRSGG